jgi:hypothetical protein
MAGEMVSSIEPEVYDIERHDISTPCDSRTSVFRNGQWTDLAVCLNKATWWARLLCCPRVIFSCDPHKKNRFSRCSSCSSQIDRSILMWAKL